MCTPVKCTGRISLCTSLGGDVSDIMRGWCNFAAVVAVVGMEFSRPMRVEMMLARRRGRCCCLHVDYRPVSHPRMAEASSAAVSSFQM